jgi:hypothetical protein
MIAAITLGTRAMSTTAASRRLVALTEVSMIGSAPRDDD